MEKLAKLLDEYEERTGHSIPIHIDGASGAFIAPFATPEIRWDFEIPRVVSINTSGHKYGLVYPVGVLLFILYVYCIKCIKIKGIGWVLWRSQEALPKELVFELHYLGGKLYLFVNSDANYNIHMYIYIYVCRYRLHVYP